MATATNVPAAPRPENRVAPPQSFKTFRDLIITDGYKDQLAAALPKGLSAERMARVVITAINRTPALLECSVPSLWESVLNAASLGLFPDALGRCYLVPFKGKCQLIVGYKGLVDLAFRSGQVDNIQAVVVRKGDHFVYERGLTPKLEHKPCDEPGELTHVYSVIHIKGASHATFEVMSKRDVDLIRARSQADKGGMSPWKTDYNEMARKTVLKRHLKLCPMSTEEMAAALAEHQEEDDTEDTILANAAKARLQDTFQHEVETTAVNDRDLPLPLADALTKAHASGMNATQIVAELVKAGATGDSIEACAASLPADKVQRAVDLLDVAARATAEG